MSRWLYLAIVLIACGGIAPARAAIPEYGYEVVHVYPHDTGAYTEGLFYKDGYLYESTGMAGQSTVRKVELASGEAVQTLRLPANVFGEGIVQWRDQLIQLSWKSRTGFVYDFASFKPLRKFHYSGEGWALTRDDQHLYMSDGSDVIRVLDPDTLAVVSRIHVTADGVAVTSVNELEWIKGELYANIWLTDRIARIDPATGHVVGWIDLSGLLDVGALPNPVDDVLNGIAYDAARDRLFVTGKCWPKLFEIKLVKRD